METKHDKALRTLANTWELDGDLMRCRECGRALIASRDGEKMRHRSGCKRAKRGDPWQELRRILGVRANARYSVEPTA